MLEPSCSSASGWSKAPPRDNSGIRSAASKLTRTHVRTTNHQPRGSQDYPLAEYAAGPMVVIRAPPREARVGFPPSPDAPYGSQSSATEDFAVGTGLSPRIGNSEMAIDYTTRRWPAHHAHATPTPAKRWRRGSESGRIPRCNALIMNGPLSLSTTAPPLLHQRSRVLPHC